MPSRNKWICVLLGAVMMIVSGCAKRAAWESAKPEGFLPTPVEAQHSAYGGWIILEDVPKGSDINMEGEFIAIENDSLFVLTADGLVGVSQSGIGSFTLGYVNPDTGSMATGITLGTLSTLTHGYFLVLSAPIWIFTGTAATAQESRSGRVTEEAGPWESLRKYARFPQGLGNIDRKALEPKPLKAKVQK